MIKSTRRGFLVGCSAAIASYAGSRFNTLSFGDPNENSEMLIVVFLRGGVDGLNLVPPIAGPDRGHYVAARPNLAIPNSGPDAALPLEGQFGLHPSAAPLLDLYQNGDLAIIQAVGMSTVLNKSHFDAMQFVELGTPGEKSISSGWLTRHLQTAGNLPTDLVMPSLAVGDLQPTSLLGELSTINMNDPRSFNIANGPWNWRPQQKAALRSMFEANTSWLNDGGVSALNAIDIVESSVTGEYEPANGAVYPDGPFGQQLQVLAQMIKLDLGLQVATLDFGGWDTHENQGTTAGVYADQVDTLSRGLNAFYTDLDGVGASSYTNRLTVVAQSEFGRELHENGDRGTEHGYGNQMLVLSGNAIGGLHGTWPGLGAGQLVDGTDLAVTTDYRQVLSEILIRRMCNTNIETIFPGYTGYRPLGIVNGTDLPLPNVFSDGFESGDSSAWSNVVG
ncbi:MAG: DUF1501 domain-containing protein [Acidobacteriota bacterium]